MPADGIVDGLETLHVGNDQRKPALPARRGTDILRQALIEEGAIGKTGERVVVGEIVESLGLLDVIQREGNIAAQVSQQTHLRRVEETTLVHDEHQASHRLRINHQRQSGNRAIATLNHLPRRRHEL